MSDTCNCIDIKVEVMMDEPEINGEVDVSEVILCSDGEDYKRGYEEGHAQGLTDGRVEGYENGYSEGKKSEYDTFWDSYQQNGERTNYRMAFSYDGWTDKAFKPKYDIVVVGSCDYMFTDNHSITNLKASLEQSGVRIDTSQATSLAQSFFRMENNTALPPFDLSSCTNVGQAWRESSKLESLELYNIKKEAIGWSLALYNLTGLVNLVCTGTFGESINLAASSLLNETSVQNIIDCLADLMGQKAQTLTLHATVKAKLTDEQIATITSKNWTLP